MNYKSLYARPERLATGISVFPNPTKSEVHITSQYLPLQVAVLNSQGVFIATQDLIQNETTLSFDRFPPGLYIIRIRAPNEETQTFKLIKR